jgi:hypothetical protein
MVNFDDSIRQAALEAAQHTAPSRDQLAAMAMQAQIANPGWMNSGTGWDYESTARNAYEQADAMLAERAKKPKES